MALARLSKTLPRDENNNVIQVAGKQVYEDGTGTPQVSPLSLTTTSLFTIVPPSGALVCTFKCAAAFRHGTGNVDGTASDGYFAVAANTSTRVSCADLTSIIVRNEATGTNNLFFTFEMMG